MEKDTPAFRQLQEGNTKQGSNLAENPSTRKARKSKQDFIPIPRSLLTSDLSRAALLMALALINCAGGKRSIRVGLPYLAGLTNTSIDLAKRGIKELEEKGLIATLHTGRTSEYFLGGSLDVFQEAETEPKLRPRKSRKEKENPAIRKGSIALSDSADLHSLQIHNYLIEKENIHNTEKRELDLENSALIEPRFDDVADDEKAFETFLSLGFEAWLKEVSERASRLVGSFLNLNSSSPKLSNSRKALEAFYKEGHSPQEVAELVNLFILNYPRRIKNKAALVASNFEAILLQTPKADKALETPLCSNCREFLTPCYCGQETPPLWVSSPVIDEPPAEFRKAFEEPLKVLTEEELEALRLEQAERSARAAEAQRLAEFERFSREVLSVRPSSTEAEIELLFTSLTREVWSRAKAVYQGNRLGEFLNKELTKLSERVN